MSAAAATNSDERPRARDVEKLIATLAATGAEVVLVDRSQGRLYAGSAMVSRPARARARPRGAPRSTRAGPDPPTATAPRSAPALGAPALEVAALDAGSALPGSPERP